MKLPVSEIKTNCEKCTYAIFSSGNQIGCETGRLDKFEQLEQAVVYKNEDKSWYGLKRFCNLYREKKQDINEAKKQIASTFGLVVSDHSDEYSNIAIESLKDINYDQTKYKIVISSKHRNKSNELFNYVNYFNKIRDISCDLSVELDDIKAIIDYNMFSKCAQCAYFVKIESNKALPRDVLSYVNDSINEHLEKITFYEGDGFTIVPSWIVNKFYIEFNDYELLLAELKKQSLEQDMYRKYAR